MSWMFGAGAVPAQSGPPRFRYVPELEMATVGKRNRLRPAMVDATTGLASLSGDEKDGTPAWISTRTIEPGEEVFQQHLRDTTILQPLQHHVAIRDDLGFATGLDKTRKAVVIARRNHLARHESLFEVSNIIGLKQGDEAYLGQLEMRWGADGRVLHMKRTQQRAGPLVANGFPGFVTWEMVQTESENRTDFGRMARVHLVFPNGSDGPARIRVHLVGEFRRKIGGAFETRNVHVITEIRNGMSVKVWTSEGESYPYLSWERAFALKHESSWRRAGSGGASGSHAWERPFHPYAPERRGVRPIPVVTLLALPPNWNQGGFSGAALRSKKLKIKGGRWALTSRDFLFAGGVWQFDKRGELCISSPLGKLSSAKVLKWFKARFQAAKGRPDDLAELRSCLEVILNWAADLPQLDGARAGKGTPKVRRYLK